MRASFSSIGNVLSPGWYVNTSTGNDANSGQSPSQAWKTFSKADSSVGSGLVPQGSTINVSGTVVAGGIVLNHGGVIYSFNGPTIDGSSDAAGTRGLTINGANLTLLNLAVQNTAGSGIFPTAANIQLLGGLAFHCGWNPTELFGQSGIITGANAANLIVDSFNCYGNNGHGIYISAGAANPTIRRSLLHDNGNPSKVWGDGLQINGTTQGGLVEKNLIWNNWSSQVNLNTSGQSGTVYRNNGLYVDFPSALYWQPYGTGSAGAHFNIGSNITNLSLYSNTLSMLVAGGKLIVVNSGCTGYTFKDNLGLDLGGTKWLPFQFNGMTAPPSGWMVDYNGWYSGQANIYEFGTTGHTWAQWQALGFDAHGFNADPRFLSATDLHLQNGSPAIGSGLDLSSMFTDDLSGDTRTIPWSDGCYK